MIQSWAFSVMIVIGGSLTEAASAGFIRKEVELLPDAKVAVVEVNRVIQKGPPGGWQNGQLSKYRS